MTDRKRRNPKRKLVNEEKMNNRLKNLIKVIRKDREYYERHNKNNANVTSK